MPRYLLTIEYDGTPFCGWQRQENGMTVQEVVETAGRLFTGTPCPVYAAGRTDTGVHAEAMSAHIDLPREYDPFTVMNALNAHIRPHPVSVLSAQEITPDLHARFSCYRRAYRYRFLDRRTPAPLRKNRVWHITQALDAEAMAQAAQAFIGKHDFTTFRSAQCQAESPVKTIETVSVDRVGDEVHLHLAAPSFLHNQVRSIAGTLAQVGLGRWPIEEVGRVLEAADRTLCGPVAPACGLYFMRADYPEDLLNADPVL